MKLIKADKLVIIGGSYFLAELIKTGIKELPWPVVVFCAPRHLEERIGETTLEKLLKRNKINYYKSADINHDNNFINEVSKKSLGVALGAPWIFDKKTVNLFPKNCLLDFMAIDLPRYRGGAHHTWRILQRNNKGCVNIQFIQGGEKTYQRGKIIKRFEFIYPAGLKTPGDCYNYSLKQEIEFFKEFLIQVKSGQDFNISALNEDESSHYPFLYTPENGLINWNWNGYEISLFINAFDEPYPGASTYLNNKKVFLKDCQLLFAQDKYHAFTSGLVVRKKQKAIYIAVIGYLLKVNKVLNNKGKNIFSEIQLGDRFYTPYSKLDKAMTFKADYNAAGIKKKAKRIT